MSMEAWLRRSYIVSVSIYINGLKPSWISTKEQCCGRLGTSSCIVCSISYSRLGANVTGGVEVVMVIVVER